ncbi:hypothetical protein EMIHUDRAFT_435873 [Emiliania huxleyi CCMP1516]|uniref:Uncharacterized protein n=2 Tax=Emiliania huxleyi TaxID=2903 RepID=A0A0D3JAL4_EMIH1|nr:hypothetical protein EMIHUDRAFT_435873 [Emiliania huxleyi CCMP1516]EOD20549.1 hypothetical protein EMIHUDRAFT_435873 [Emiliania huxleyi CCMP1516]|eukprot:XP_005772978.1 hypothetical protein EMIHUDRAFT_435873 [Emiliania huxleyi CCMP1516]
MLATSLLCGAFMLPRPPQPHVSTRAPPLCMKVVDLFPDAPTVGGIQVVPKPSSFPDALDAPTVAKAATITPFPDVADVIFAPTGGSDLVAALFVGTALLLGPDFLLAPAGLVSSRGIRPGYALEGVVGELATPDAQWLRDRREQLAADAPLSVRLAVWSAFVAAGLLVERLLLVALEDAGFVISAGVCACIGGGLLEESPAARLDGRPGSFSLATLCLSVHHR